MQIDNSLNTLTNCNGFPPIGALMPWLKSFTNTPSLPTGWVECDGSTLSDAASVYNGQVLPNLNGGNRFPRGNSTSGGTGGAATVTLVANNLPTHTHALTDGGHSHGTGIKGGNFVSTSGTTVDAGVLGTNTILGSASTTASATTGITVGNNTTTNTAVTILPLYYDVVWIMRVK